MKNLKSKFIAFTVVLTLILSVSTVFAENTNTAQQSPNSVRRSLDKTPFLDKIKTADKEAGYSDFYKTANPNDKDFPKKFKEFATKLDNLNKSKGIKSSFDLNKILNSKNVVTDTSIGFGSGTPGNYYNYFNPAYSYTGDILLVNNPGSHLQGSIQHTQMMDKGRYYNYNSGCEITAEPNLGVIYETPNQTRSYNEVWDTYALAAYPQYVADGATYSAEAYLGCTYVWAASKSDDSWWYCSKLPYRGYLDYAGINIDYNDGYWCLPEDILYSDEIAVDSYYN